MYKNIYIKTVLLCWLICYPFKSLQHLTSPWLLTYVCPSATNEIWHWVQSLLKGVYLFMESLKHISSHWLLSYLLQLVKHEAIPYICFTYQVKVIFICDKIIFIITLLISTCTCKFNNKNSIFNHLLVSACF